jgi:hypothetical protein
VRSQSQREGINAISAIPSEGSSAKTAGRPRRAETMVAMAAFNGGENFRAAKESAVSPNPRSARREGERRRGPSASARAGITRNGKKNSPAKSLSLPVQNEGKRAFRTWSFRSKRTTPSRTAGCMRVCPLIQQTRSELSRAWPSPRTVLSQRKGSPLF